MVNTVQYKLSSVQETVNTSECVLFILFCVDAFCLCCGTGAYLQHYEIIPIC